MTTARTVAEVIAAEATSGTPAQRLADMRAIASVIQNRASQLGVSMEDVVAYQPEFNAYGNRMPPGTANLVDMAQEAIDYVAENGPVTKATYYATPRSVPNLPNDLSYETETSGHQFFSDPHGRAIRTAAGTITPNRYAFAQNLTDVPTPFSPDQLAPADTQGAIAAPVDNMPGHWGLNPDVAPVPYETFNQWEAMANAPPVQAPPQGLLSTPQGLLTTPADLQNFAEGMNAQRQTIPQQSMPTLSNFADLADAGPMGGDFAAPQDRFAENEPSQSQPFDHYVNTTSYPATVDYGSYPPGSVPMVDTSAVAPNRVQTSAITPGLLGAAAPMTDGFSQMASAGPFGGDYAAPAERFDPQPSVGAPQITQADVQRGLFNVTADGQMDPSFTAGLLGPQNPVVPTAVETTSYTPDVDIASSRFSTPAKTSRIGQDPTFDAARMPGQLDPATNTASLTEQPADIGGFLSASAAQRGPSTGLLSAEMQAMQGHVAYEAQKAEQARQAAMVAANPGLLAPNLNQALNPTVPSMPTPSSLTASMQTQQPSELGATPQQQAAGYLQFAANAPQITNLSGMTGIWDDGTAFQNAIPGPALAPASEMPALEVAQVSEQPTIAEVPGPATTTAARTTPTTTTQNKSLLSGLLSPEALGGGLLGGLALGPAGGLVGALAGQQIARNGGLSSMLSGGSFSAPTTHIAGGVNNIGGLYGGAFSPGSFAVANNGATVTQQPGGWTSYTNAAGVTNMISPTGQQSAYFGGLLSRDDEDQDAEAESNSSGGGLFGGWS